MINNFLITPGLGSSYLMGVMLSKYANGTCYSKGAFDKLAKIKNSNIILVKKFIRDPGQGDGYDPNIIQTLKKNNNKIIYIVIDGFACEQSRKDTIFIDSIKKYKDLYDLILWPNKFTCEKYSHLGVSDTLYHLYDDKIKPNVAKEFNITYFGILRKDKVLFNEKVKQKLNVIDCCGDPAKQKIKPGCSSLTEELIKYSCHYSVRGKKFPEFTYGVNTKLSSAAASNANIICSRDKCFEELLPEYDYYIDDVNNDSINEMYNRCEREFGTKNWEKNLQLLEKVRKETAPKFIGNKLNELIKKHL